MESMPNPSRYNPRSEQRVKEEAFRLQAYEKARTLFEERALNETDFIENTETGRGVYTEETVRKNLEYVARLDEIFQREREQEHANAFGESKEKVKQYADIFEAIVLIAIQRLAWFGPEATAVKTAKFDDYANGIDILTALNHSRKPLALAVDVTFGLKGMQKKIAIILDKIEKGELSYVRYYRSEDGSYEGKLNNLARVVVGVEMETVQKMAEYWLRNDDETLRHHFAQTLVLSEIAVQLREFSHYARKVGQEKIASAYDTDLEKIGVILAEKPDDHMEKGIFDRVYGSILKTVRDSIAERLF
jgi:hypothetical protein